MRTKLLVSLLFAAASSSVFAMPSDPTKHSGVLEVALTGGGFVVGTENQGYGLQTSEQYEPFGDFLANDSEYKFGGGVLFGYYFPCSSINVDASYFGTRNRTTDDAVGIVVPEVYRPINGIFAAAASSSYHYDYDFANVEVGSLTRVNNNGLIINPKVGLSYARLKGNQDISYDGVDEDDGSPIRGHNSHLYSKFNGFGPSIGLDLNYIVCSPINLTGSFRYNALVGDINASYATADTDIATADVSLKSARSLVSLVQSEIALGYDFDWVDAFCGNIAIGYQLTKAIGSGQKLAQVDDYQGTFLSNSVTDANIHGWFLRLTMDFPV